jgi:uncharacterized protein YyaL (SSP411 family)
MVRFLYLGAILLYLSSASCQVSPKQSNEDMEKHSESRTPNRLATETSPYLLQHQYNPVDWFPWGEEAFEKAKAEDKLILISIGYSACHWCHVMERESFENDSVAKVMNEHYVCIKVDREERPDVDQVYMEAVQMMTGRGGWPLNCFTLPDGRPIYGGTYFPTEHWTQILEGLNQTWTSDRQKVMGYADELMAGLQQDGPLVPDVGSERVLRTSLAESVQAWRNGFDHRDGGMDHSPKFPMPTNYQFLLRYGALSGDSELVEHVHLTLKKMALGGIYDQVGGGFARYSTDHFWKVPHFEKMLYDNGQLLDLYSEAYRNNQDPLYEEVAAQTIDWLEREMLSSEGAFYSALDADSEGEEGRFYIWTEEELQAALDESQLTLAKEIFSLDRKGLWEGRYILLRPVDLMEQAKMLSRPYEELLDDYHNICSRLLEAREKRERPGLDDKTLASWNALTISGLCSAYMTFRQPRYLDLALKNAGFLWSKMQRSDGGWYHSYKKGDARINAYLDDLAFLAQAAIDLYQVTMDEEWLERSKTISEYAISHFYDDKTGDFYFTSDEDAPLITRKKELQDNVIPSSNSAMAKVLHTLGTLYDRKDFKEKADRMTLRMQGDVERYGSSNSNWADLMLREAYPYHEIAIMGDDPAALVLEFGRNHLPNSLFLGATDDSSRLPLLDHKFVENETMIYVCVEKSCQLPVNQVEDALKQFQRTP